MNQITATAYLVVNSNNEYLTPRNLVWSADWANVLFEARLIRSELSALTLASALGENVQTLHISINANPKDSP